MNKLGPVIVIDDDEDDQLLLELIFDKLAYPNQILYFSDGQQAMAYLETSSETPFLILSDINMPRLDGFALRQQIHANPRLRTKCIPYLFFSTGVTPEMVLEAYGLSVQGFFIKDTTFVDLEKTIRTIMEYWQRCVSPNNFQ